MPFLEGTWALEQFGEKHPKCPYVMYRVTQKIIQSLQLLISHQMRPYPNVKAFYGSNDTCFTGTQYWTNFEKFGPNTLSHLQGQPNSNPNSSFPHFSSNETLH